MKEITLKITENKIRFFIELVTQLGFEIVNESDIPEEHIAMVRERIHKSIENPERLLHWEKVKGDFRLD